MKDERKDKPDACDSRPEPTVKTWTRPSLKVVPATRSETHVGNGADTTHGLS